MVSSMDMARVFNNCTSDIPTQIIPASTADMSLWFLIQNNLCHGSFLLYTTCSRSKPKTQTLSDHYEICGNNVMNNDIVS